MSEGDNTNMYIGLAVIVVVIGYYYMFMMTPAPITCDTGYILKDGKCVLVQVTSVAPVAPATGTSVGTLTGADAAAAAAAAADAAKAAAARAAATDAAAAAARAAATDAAARATAAADAAKATADANIISSNSYVLKNDNNGRCLIHANNGAGNGPIEDWPGSPFCDPNSSQFSTQALWKLIEHPTIKGSYVLKNDNNGRCLIHANNGAGNGPIEDWPGSPFCDPNSSQFSTQALWKFTKT